MSNQNGFFGDIFGSAEDDPLLQSDQDAFSSRGDGASSVSEPQSVSESESQSESQSEPSRASSREPSHTASSPDSSSADSSSPKTDAMEVQEVVLHQSGNETNGLAELNEAVEDGWRFSHVSLDDRIRSASGDVDTKITVLMERNTPRSLFDFGGAY
jgi:hypothetical protein